jgi:hypothetical protein
MTTYSIKPHTLRGMIFSVHTAIAANGMQVKLSKTSEKYT